MTTHQVKTLLASLKQKFFITAQWMFQSPGTACTRTTKPKGYLSAALVITLALLAACGPGTGGTGTGPQSATVSTSLSFSGISGSAGLASVSTSSTPDGLLPTVPTGTTTGTTPSLPAPPPGGELVPEVCLVNCTGMPVSLLIEAQQVRLQTRCVSFVSSGPLVAASTGETVLAGNFETQQLTNGQLTNGQLQNRRIAALLVMTFSSQKLDSDWLKIRLVDSTGALLLGPLTLLRDVAGPVTVPYAAMDSCK